jgi:hypothetical protein
MNFSFHSAFKRLLRLVCLATLATFSSVAYAQSGGTFVSGSTGADGAFSPTAGAPGTTTTVTLPARTYHFTTITIPSNVTVQFTRSPGNPPVVLLATGDVRIEGRITVAGTNGNSNGVGGTGGPGGFNGGNGAFGTQTTRGSSGEGPGGGGGGFSLTATVGSWAGAGGGYATSGNAPATSFLSAVARMERRLFNLSLGVRAAAAAVCRFQAEARPAPLKPAVRADCPIFLSPQLAAGAAAAPSSSPVPHPLY